jgi:hypothetical protein
MFSPPSSEIVVVSVERELEMGVDHDMLSWEQSCFFILLSLAQNVWELGLCLSYDLVSYSNLLSLQII